MVVQPTRTQRLNIDDVVFVMCGDARSDKMATEEEM